MWDNQCTPLRDQLLWKAAVLKKKTYNNQHLPGALKIQVAGELLVYTQYPGISLPCCKPWAAQMSPQVVLCCKWTTGLRGCGDPCPFWGRSNIVTRCESSVRDYEGEVPGSWGRSAKCWVVQNARFCVWFFFPLTRIFLLLWTLNGLKDIIVWLLAMLCLSAQCPKQHLNFPYLQNLFLTFSRNGQDM